MTRLLPFVSTLALAAALGAPALSQDHGRGHGGEKGRGGEAHARGPQADRGPGGAPGRDRGPERGGPRVEAPRAGPPARETRDVRDAARAQDRAVQRAEVRREDRRERAAAPVALPGRIEPARFRLTPDRGLIAGCPPGLARKDNGCLPPGQARQIAAERARYDYVWDRYAGDGYRYRYDDGYLYRTNAQGGLLGWLPVLGGALTTGAVWPTQYSYQQTPTYFSDYYRLNDRYDYRYADGVLYGVDPQTQAIGQVAALLTGQQWTVGQPMPAGYDVYNMPYGWRDRYADTPDRWYRYSDGYAYQIDPTTQLVQAVIQLLT